MKRLFISQPMNGKTDEEILAVRKKAIKRAQEQLGEPVEVIDSFFQSGTAPEGTISGLYWLGRSLDLLSTADVAFFARGWEQARGCRIENTCAVEYGVELIIEDYEAPEDLVPIAEVKARELENQDLKKVLEEVNADLEKAKSDVAFLQAEIHAGNTSLIRAQQEKEIYERLYRKLLDRLLDS